MPFYLYKREKRNRIECFKQQRRIKVAEKTLLYKCWNSKGRPLGTHWQIDREDLIREATDGGDSKAYRIYFYYNPNAENKSGLFLLEPMKIYAYTYKKNGEARWTILLLKLRELRNQASQRILTKAERDKLVRFFCSVKYKNVSEFLYLQGDKGNWNWGRVGSVNAALIYPDVKAKFKKYL